VNMATDAGSAAVGTTREAYERDGYVVVDGVLPLATMGEWKGLVQRECVVSVTHSFSTHGTQSSWSLRGHASVHILPPCPSLLIKWGCKCVTSLIALVAYADSQ
jgi:hypothetical protein